MGLYNGKTAMSLSCSNLDSLDGERSEIGAARNLERVSQKCN